jgi:hypothetical protein
MAMGTSLTLPYAGKTVRDKNELLASFIFPNTLLDPCGVGTARIPPDEPALPSAALGGRAMSIFADSLFVFSSLLLSSLGIVVCSFQFAYYE